MMVEMILMTGLLTMGLLTMDLLTMGPPTMGLPIMVLPAVCRDHGYRTRRAGGISIRIRRIRSIHGCPYREAGIILTRPVICRLAGFR